MQVRKQSYIIFCVFIFLLSACRNKKITESPIEDINQGNINITADANYMQLVNELIKSYENVYDSADIKPFYTSEQNAVNAFLHDSVQMIVLGRNLEAGEIEMAKTQQGLVPKQNTIAYEALAVVSSLTSPDSIFDLDAFIKDRIDSNGLYAETNFIFEKANSGALTYLLQKTGLPQEATRNMFAVDSLQELIRYLGANENSIGFLSFAKISDMDDPAVKSIMAQVKILPVIQTDTSGRRMIIELSQSTIATGEYPFVRPIVIVVGNISERIGTGFVNFLYKTKSGRIFLKAGLVPYQIPERQLLIKDE